jgi:hypothetical protein
MDRELSDRMAELEDRLRAIESEDSLRARGRTLTDRIVPPEARRHFRNGGREGLLGMRTIVDSWIRRLDEKDAAEPQPASREHIPIE